MTFILCFKFEASPVSFFFCLTTVLQYIAITKMTCRRIVCCSWLLISLSNAWVLPASTSIKSNRRVCRFSTPNDQESEEKVTSFDEAGQGLRDEEDNRRMDEAGDFDSNPAVSIVFCHALCF